MSNTPLTKEQKQMLYEMRDNTNRQEVARIVGCTPCTAYRYQKRYGGKILPYTERWQKYPTLPEYVEKYWASMSASDIAKMVGCSVQNVYSYTFYHGIKRTKEQREIIEPKRRERLSATAAKQLKLEKSRRMFGLEPLNGRFRHLAPSRILKVTYGLHHNHGYGYTDDPYTMSRNGHSLEGNRKGCDENYYINKYGLKFID